VARLQRRLASGRSPRHGAAMSVTEWIAVALGVANIILIIRRSVWNFPVALLMVALYGRIFWGLKLYSDAGLQVFFFIVNLIGWWMWRANEAQSGEVQVERLSTRGRWMWIAGSAIAVALWGWIMHSLTDASLPWADAAIAMLSVAAQILMTRRYFENWAWWIVVNAVSIVTYAAKGIPLSAGLYALFLVMSVIGLNEWKKAIARS
jgi:nicotinamide mononucleotide transporter